MWPLQLTEALTRVVDVLDAAVATSGMVLLVLPILSV